MSERMITHWAGAPGEEGCETAHHECALRQLRDARRELAEVKQERDQLAYHRYTAADMERIFGERDKIAAERLEYLQALQETIDALIGEAHIAASTAIARARKLVEGK